MKTTNILIIDDHQLMLDGLQLMLRDVPHFHVVDQATNGKIGLMKLKEHEIDLVLLDINMPVMDGIECCEKILENHPNIHVIGLSMVEELTVMKKLYSLGAKGYLLKNSSKEKVIRAIETVINGGIYMNQEHLTSLLTATQPAKNTVRMPKLSRREKEILDLIADEKTTKEIADQLHIAFGTVETHRRNILNKLKVKNTAGLIRSAMQWGLLD